MCTRDWLGGKCRCQQGLRQSVPLSYSDQAVLVAEVAQGARFACPAWPPNSGLGAADVQYGTVFGGSDIVFGGRIRVRTVFFRPMTSVSALNDARSTDPRWNHFRSITGHVFHPPVSGKMPWTIGQMEREWNGWGVGNKEILGSARVSLSN